jgi:hypothetical protein
VPPIEKRGGTLPLRDDARPAGFKDCGLMRYGWLANGSAGFENLLAGAEDPLCRSFRELTVFEPRLDITSRLIPAWQLEDRTQEKGHAFGLGFANTSWRRRGVMAVAFQGVPENDVSHLVKTRRVGMLGQLTDRDAALNRIALDVAVQVIEVLLRDVQRGQSRFGIPMGRFDRLGVGLTFGLLQAEPARREFEARKYLFAAAGIAGSSETAFGPTFDGDRHPQRERFLSLADGPTQGFPATEARDGRQGQALLTELDGRQDLVADAEAVKPAESLTDDPGLGEGLFEKGCEFVVHGASSEKREGTVPVGERYTPRGMEKPAKAGKVCCVSSG